MTPFCENRLCRLHSVKIEGPERFVKYIEANGNECQARRMVLYNAELKQTRAFCEICANAALMIHEGKT